MVLIIDDDLAFLESAKKALGKDYFVLEATTATQALDLIKAIDFSIALVDLELPGASGFDLIETLHHSRPGLPIVAISGVCSRATLESAKELGASEILEKPISSEWNSAIVKLRRPDPARRPYFTHECSN